jgi:hypothetical protein
VIAPCMRRLNVCTMILMVQAFACGAGTDPSSADRRFGVISKVGDMTASLPYRARAAVIGTMYEVLFSSIPESWPLKEVGDAELRARYAAAQLTEFYTIGRRHLGDMKSLLNELQRRSLASKTDYVDMYEALLKARQLTEARDLAAHHPMLELEPIPELREAADLVAGQPTEWAVDPSRKELLRRNVDIQRPTQVVIVSHPLCHFSRAAAESIQADPVLGKIFAAHARWLAPQSARIDFNVIQQFNREHPEQETTLTFDREEWPMIDSWTTPTFYFLRKGAVIAKVTGWPKEGHRTELLAALRDVGVVK